MVFPMKTLLCFLLCLLMPLMARAEAPVTQLGTATLFLAGDVQSVFEHVSLPDGGALLNVHTLASLDGLTDGDWNMLYLVRIDASGAPLWETRYHAGGTNNTSFDLAVDKHTATVTVFEEPYGAAACQRMTLRFDMETGGQLGSVELLGIPTEDIASFTHMGEFRIEQYLRNYEGGPVRTVITHMPTLRQAEYQVDGLRTYHAFGDKLIIFCTDAPDSRKYWVCGADCLPVLESAHAPLDGTNPAVTHSAHQGDTLYLFVWTNRDDPDHRSYTVYPMDETLHIGDAMTTFTLGEGNALGQVAACGDGFLLTEVYPWEYCAPTRYDLLHLCKDGTVTPIMPGIQHMSGEVILLPGPGESNARVIYLDEAGSYCQSLYADN